jgi:hypothetical protein
VESGTYGGSDEGRRDLAGDSAAVMYTQKRFVSPALVLQMDEKQSFVSKKGWNDLVFEQVSLAPGV